MNWSRFASVDAPQLIGFAIAAVNKIHAAKGADKEAAVIATVKDSLPLVEGAVGKDVVNDAAFEELLASYIRSRVALANFLTKPAPPEGIIAPQ